MHEYKIFINWSYNTYVVLKQSFRNLSICLKLTYRMMSLISDDFVPNSQGMTLCHDQHSHKNKRNLERREKNLGLFQEEENIFFPRLFIYF